MKFEAFESYKTVRRIIIEASTREEAYHKWLTGQGKVDSDYFSYNEEDTDLLELNVLEDGEG